MLSGYKTDLINIIALVSAGAMALDWTTVLSAENAALVLGALSIANLILRRFTGTPPAIASTRIAEQKAAAYSPPGRPYP